MGVGKRNTGDKFGAFAGFRTWFFQKFETCRVGEVRYHYRYLEGEGMGIRFVRLGGDDLEHITQFVDARVGNA